MTAGEWERKDCLGSLIYIHGFKQLLMQFRLGIKLKREVRSGEREKRKHNRKLSITSKISITN